MKNGKIFEPCYCQAKWVVAKTKGKTCLCSAKEKVGPLKLCGKHAKVARRGFISRTGFVSDIKVRAAGEPPFTWVFGLPMRCARKKP